MRRDTTIVCLVSALVGLTSSSACSSTSSPGFAQAGSSSSSSGGSSSGSSGGSDGSSSGSGSSSGVGRDAALEAAPFNDAGIPYCGSALCDLKSNTCCLSQTLQTMCNPHGSSPCPADWAAFNCLTESDCPTSGEVCCGSADSISMVAQTACQMLVNGACGTNTSAAGYAQICKTTEECMNGMECVKQSCNVNSALPPANLSMCGLQTQTPFNCSAD